MLQRDPAWCTAALHLLLVETCTLRTHGSRHKSSLQPTHTTQQIKLPASYTKSVKLPSCRLGVPSLDRRCHIGRAARMLWAVATCTESSTHTSSNSSQEPFAVSHDAGMPVCLATRRCSFGPLAVNSFKNNNPSHPTEIQPCSSQPRSLSKQGHACCKGFPSKGSCMPPI